ncbi:MAG: DNA mismatch repair protein MutS [Elusimicrobia bacterium]|nr:DNA mismatch repair protein MutS [Elusimicrobiota bacterium]
MNPSVEIPETPLMQQYQALKASYPHAILFFRLGDFYEMFADDARTASGLLGLVLTSRQGVPMCGLPYHSSSNYIAKLLAAGRKVAICEQISPSGEDAKKTKLFKREVVRLITPGTIVEDELLQTKSANYLAAIEIDLVGWGLAYIEVSTGEFFATQNLNDPDFYQLSALLSRIAPSEILAGAKTAAEIKKRGLADGGASLSEYSTAAEGQPLTLAFSEKVRGQPPWTTAAVWQNNRLALKTALNVTAYIKANQPGVKESFSPAFFEPSNKMQLDDSAIKTLELVSSEYGEEAKTLWGVLDSAITSMGSRMLKKWILEPLTALHEINARQQFTAFLAADREARESLSAILSQIPDIERVLGRVVNASAAPRDAAAIRKALSQLPKLKLLLSSARFFECVPELSGRLDSASRALNGLREILDRAITASPPAKLSDGGVINEGHSAELDELRSLRKNSQKLLIDIELKEREKTHISSLKVGYNSVFGYYLEVTKTHLPKVPHYYLRKQTLVNAERFITEELKVLESKILGAEERILKLETHLFAEIKDLLLQNLKELRTFALCAAELDVFYALAESALRYDFARPRLTTGAELIIEEGRHPVAERYLPAGSFVPNDLNIGDKDPQIIILTGPNMSGKSVYLRQNALIVIMAQLGGFVPAKSAVIGVTDRIMTRIGAQDRLSRGESTFMVEMRETASILSLATPKSLILLDEVGRGTSTFDGISIAWAVAEYLYKPMAATPARSALGGLSATAPSQSGALSGEFAAGDAAQRLPPPPVLKTAGPEGGPKVLFATHYFELTELAEKFSGIKNFNVSVKEWANSAGKTEVVFLHKIVPGPADKSYGIHVAQLAGLPDASIKRAKEILHVLETKGNIEVSGADENITPLLPIFSEHPVVDEIKLCEPDNMSPMQALTAIIEWKKRLK